MLTAAGDGRCKVEVEVVVLVPVALVVGVAFLSASGSGLPCRGDAVDSSMVVQPATFDVTYGVRVERARERKEWGGEGIYGVCSQRDAVSPFPSPRVQPSDENRLGSRGMADSKVAPRQGPRVILESAMPRHEGNTRNQASPFCLHKCRKNGMRPTKRALVVCCSLPSTTPSVKCTSWNAHCLKSY
jgi:hypothetical protein